MKNHSLLDPEQAWSLMEKLSRQVEELWEIHGDAFNKRCLKENPLLAQDGEEAFERDDLPY